MVEKHVTPFTFKNWSVSLFKINMQFTSSFKIKNLQIHDRFVKVIVSLKCARAERYLLSFKIVKLNHQATRISALICSHLKLFFEYNCLLSFKHSTPVVY